MLLLFICSHMYVYTQIFVPYYIQHCSLYIRLSYNHYDDSNKTPILAYGTKSKSWKAIVHKSSMVNNNVGMLYSTRISQLYSELRCQQ